MNDIILNMGTPMILGSLLYLLVGNSLIGVLEGFLIAKFFKVKVRKAIGFMVVANYFSAFVGVFVLPLFENLVPVTVATASMVLGGLMLISIVMTLLLEAVFVSRILKGRSVFSKLKALIGVHVVSYSLVIAWFVLICPSSALTELEIVEADELLPKENYTIYSIGENGVVQKTELHSIGTSQLTDQTTNGGWLVVSQSRELLNISHSSSGQEMKSLNIRLEGQLGLIPTVDEEVRYRHPIHFPEVVEFSPIAGECETTLVWPSSGVQRTDESSEKIEHYALATPLLSWKFTKGTRLNKDLLLVDVNGEVCLLNFKEKKLAPLFKGSSPVVEMKP